MRFLSLTLEAFGRERGRSISFSDGFNVFVGANESGKTTLIDALLLTLFGPKDRELVSRYRPRNGDRYAATLTVATRDGSLWRLRRDLADPKATIVHRQEAGEWRLAKDREWSRVYDDLGLSDKEYRLARATLVVGADAAALDDGSRKVVSQALAQITGGGEAAASAQTARNRLDSFRRAVENARLAAAQERLTEAEKRREAALSAASEAERLERERRQAAESLASAREEQARLAPAVRAFEEWRSAKATFDTARQSWEAAHERLSTFERLLDEADAARARLSALPSRPDLYTSERLAHLRELEKTARTFEGERAPLQTELNALQARLADSDAVRFTAAAWTKVQADLLYLERLGDMPGRPDRTGADAGEQKRTRSSRLVSVAAGFLALATGAAGVAVGLAGRMWGWLLLIPAAILTWMVVRAAGADVAGGSERNSATAPSLELSSRTSEPRGEPGQRQTVEEVRRLRAAVGRTLGGLSLTEFAQRCAETDELRVRVRELAARLVQLDSVASRQVDTGSIVGRQSETDAPGRVQPIDALRQELVARLAEAGQPSVAAMEETAALLATAQRELSIAEMRVTDSLGAKTLEMVKDETREADRQYLTAQTLLQDIEAKLPVLEPAQLLQYRSRLETLDLEGLRAAVLTAEARWRQHSASFVAGDSWEVGAAIAAARKEVEHLQLQAAAVRIAIGELDRAAQAVNSGVLPRVGARSGELMNQVTQGRYDRVEISPRSDGFSVAVGLAGDRLIASEELSSGTRDQLYLALRIALAEALILRPGCPLILDDPFVTYDEQRARSAVAALTQLAAGHQIILVSKDVEFFAHLAEDGLLPRESIQRLDSDRTSEARDRTEA